MNQYFVISIDQGDEFNIVVSPQESIVITTKQNVTSVALQSGETGTDVNVQGSPITSTGTFVINIPVADANKTGKLSNEDWQTFNNKQDALGYTPEDEANKSTDVDADQTSDIKYPSVKAVYDWATGLFTTAAQVAAQISTALTGYATEAWVLAQGYITSSSLINYVPYTGATANVDLGERKIKADAVEFDLNPVHSPGPGQIAYKGTTGALAYLMNSSAVECEIGQQLFAYVHNADSAQINKGDAVYIFGASGNKVAVKRAYNTSELTSARTLGLAAENIAVNQKGFVVCQGVLENINTGAYLDGTPLFLGATPGSWTSTFPNAPSHYVQLGVVEQSSVGNGTIYVKIQNGFQLDELSDVDIVSVPPVNNDVLTYITGTNNLWKPRSIGTILGYTPQEKIVITKTGVNQTTTSATAQDITELVIGTLEANTTYMYFANIRAACNNTGGIRIGFNVPTGATGTMCVINQTTSTTTLIIALADQNQLIASSVIRQATTRDLFVHGRITIAGTTGNVQFTFASATAGQTSTIFGSRTSSITFIKIP